jgi:nicotinamidase-related amidase
MKTEYFTPSTIAGKAREMLDELPARREFARSGYDPAQAALVVLDMQRYFLDPGSHAFAPSAQAVLPGIRVLGEGFIEKGRPVVLTRHLNTPENSAQMASWWADLIREEDPASEIVPELGRLKAMQIRKSQYDAFHMTGLEERLRGLGVTQVVISGVLTHLCCETTARSAFVRGFKVFFTVDGTATYYEDFHRATLLNLSHGFAVPVLVDDIRQEMESWDDAENRS